MKITEILNLLIAFTTVRTSFIFGQNLRKVFINFNIINLLDSKVFKNQYQQIAI